MVVLIVFFNCNICVPALSIHKRGQIFKGRTDNVFTNTLEVGYKLLLALLLFIKLFYRSLFALLVSIKKRLKFSLSFFVHSNRLSPVTAYFELSGS